MSRQERLAYLAGLIDADGHMHIAMSAGGGRTKKYPTPRIMVCSSDRPHLEWLENVFGGGIYLYRKKEMKLVPPFATKDMVRWEIGGRKAFELAGELKKYIVLKQYQLAKILELDRYK